MTATMKKAILGLTFSTVMLSSLSFSPMVSTVHRFCGAPSCKRSPLLTIPSMPEINEKKRSRVVMTAAGASIATPALKASIAAVTGLISGGVFAGGLHAIAGPDHLAALLPRCVGQRWYKAGRVGALWGMGHGISATILGASAYFLKSRLHRLPNLEFLLSSASSIMNIAVGGSLVIIGLLGIKEAREWKAEIETVQPLNLSAAAADSGVKMLRNRAVVFNGLLHGFSWDGAPSLLPGIAVATWRGNFTFLISYALGTMVAMACTTTLIGEGTRRAGEILHRPDIPQKLSYLSSFIAVFSGLVWMMLSFLGKLE